MFDITRIYHILILQTISDISLKTKYEPTLSTASPKLNTMKANPLERPVLGSVLTLMLSISPYLLKCSRSSSGKEITSFSSTLDHKQFLYNNQVFIFS